MYIFRDNGKLILTPIYLIFGFSFPIWLDLFRFGRVTLASYSGIISLGIGDTAASIIGKKFGKIKFGRDGKAGVL